MDAEHQKRRFSFAYNIKYSRIQYWQPVHGLFENAE